MPGDELLSVNDQPIENGKKADEIKQIVSSLQNNSIASNSDIEGTVAIYVRTALECSELIVKNTCNGMFQIKRADTSSLNLMNSGLKNETLMRLSSMEQPHVEADEQEYAWLIHTKGSI